MCKTVAVLVCCRSVAMGRGDSVVLESISVCKASRCSLDGFQNTIGNYVLRHDTMVEVETVAAVLAVVMVQ